MKSKTKLNIRLLAKILTAIIALSYFTVACQPAPEKEVVVNKAQGLPPTALNTEKDEPYQVPETWQTAERIGDGININIDAKVIFPQTSVFPVNKLERRELAQQRADELIRYFAPDTKFYSGDIMTKADYERELIEARRGQFIDGEYVVTEESKAWAKEIEKNLKNAPETNNQREISTEFAYYTDYDGKTDESRGKNYIYLNFKTADGDKASIYATRYENGKSPYNWFNYKKELNFSTQSYFEDYYFTPDDQKQYASAQELRNEDNIKKFLSGGFFENFDFTQEQAISQAEKIIADLNIGDMRIVNIEKVAVEQYEGMDFSSADGYKQGYILSYTRHMGNLDGLLGQSFASSDGDRRNDKEPEYTSPFSLESLTMVIDADGIMLFSWNDMSQVIENVSENSVLIPFDEVKERIFNQIKFIYLPMLEYTKDINAYSIEIDIHTLRLCSAYINAKNEPDKAWQVPVWVAEGKLKNIYSSEGNSDEQPIMYIVINALDGGIVHDNRFSNLLS